MPEHKVRTAAIAVAAAVAVVLSAVDGLGKSPPPEASGLIGPGCSFGDHDFGEGRRAWFQACVRHADRHLQCGRTELTRASKLNVARAR